MDYRRRTTLSLRCLTHNWAKRDTPKRCLSEQTAGPRRHLADVMTTV